MKAYLRTSKGRHFAHMLTATCSTYIEAGASRMQAVQLPCVDTRRHDFRQEGRKLSSVEARAGHATGRAYIRFTSNRRVSTVNRTIVLRPIIACYQSQFITEGEQNKAIPASLIHQNCCLGKVRRERGKKSFLYYKVIICKSILIDECVKKMFARVTITLSINLI